MKYRITFEIELPTENVSDAEDWAKFELGFNSMLPGSSECKQISLPANWDDLDLNSLRVSRVYSLKLNSV